MEAYQKNNLKLKNIIKVDNVTLDKLVSQIPLYSNCIFSGGIEVESIGGGRVYNRRLILSKFIKRIIEYYPSGGVIFYNSTYIKKIMKKWSLEYSGRKKIVFLDDEAYNYDPFKGMNKEEIIYTITNISNFVGISIDQYAQLFLEYIIKLLFISKYELNYKNILTLIYRNNEELSLIARELGLISEAKYFSKTGNGSEAIKRICFTIDNFIRSNFSDNSTNMTNVISEIKKGNIQCH